MNRPLRQIEIIKNSPALSGQEALVLGGATSVEDTELHKNVYPSRFPHAWLIQNQKYLVRTAEGTFESNTSGQTLNDAYISDLSRLLTGHQLPYAGTTFACYRQPLDRPRTSFPALNNRTVWIPATGFFAGTWHDGPTVVTEQNGLISNYLPTGSVASLLLAPDGTKAIGREAAAAATIEGPSEQRLLRGCIAAARRVLLLSPKDKICLQINDQTLMTMIRLAILRSALPKDTQLFIALHEGEDRRIAFKRFTPKFRRFCEHTGISSPDWMPVTTELSALGHFAQDRWQDLLLPAINAHGSLIPE